MKTAEFCQFTRRASLNVHFTESLFLMSKNVSKCNCDIQCFSYTVLFKMCVIILYLAYAADIFHHCGGFL